MDGHGYYVKLNKSEKDKCHMISFICGIWKKWANKTKQKKTHRYREWTDGCQRGGGWEDGQKKVKGNKRHKLPVII